MLALFLTICIVTKMKILSNITRNCLLSLVLYFLFGCTNVIKEVSVQEIKLSTPLNLPKAEISGLAWCDEKLVFLPQYPKRISNNQQSYFYYVEKKQILAYLKGGNKKPLSTKAIKVNEGLMRDNVGTFDGYEAIDCRDSTLWLSIESITEKQQFQSFLISGNIRFQPPTEIKLKPDTLIRLPSLSRLPNIGDEAILIQGNNVIAIHETNDNQLLKKALARSLNSKDLTLNILDFPSIPYRITDASQVNKHNQFWGINYKYSGDDFSRKSIDGISQRHGKGKSHKKYYNVERLLKFEITNNQINLSNTPPIQLKMTEPEGRNWEGLVILDDIGFLIVTDKHPKTIFGFIPYPQP